MRKIIQISAVPGSSIDFAEFTPSLWCLCDDGTIWETWFSPGDDKRSWCCRGSVPQMKNPDIPVG